MIACEAYIYGLRNGCDVVQYVQIEKYSEQHEKCRWEVVQMV